MYAILNNMAGVKDTKSMTIEIHGSTNLLIFIHNPKTSNTTTRININKNILYWILYQIAIKQIEKSWRY